MNRRGFFQTVAATIAAIVLPKSKKAECNEVSLAFYDTLDNNLLFYSEGFPTDINWTTGDVFYDTETRITKIYDGNRWIKIKENNNG